MTVEPSPTEGAEQEPNTTPESAESVSTDSADTSVSDAKQPPADSSSADGAEPTGSQDGEKKPTSVLGAIEGALKTDKSDADSPTATGKEGQKDKTEDDESEDDETTKDEDLPFHKHPRWQEVVAERDTLKAQAAEYKDAHEAVTRIENFMTTNNLSVEEFNTSLQISSLIRNDPHKALEALRPYYDGLLQVTGETLPPDLKTDVEAGIISENHAKELATARARNTWSQQRLEQTEARSVEQSNAQHVNTLSSVASEWERQWASSDPDYAKKSARVKDALELLWRRGEVPTTVAAMREQCEGVKKSVEKELRGFLPKKQAVAPGPNASAGGTPNSAPPKSLMEAMQRAVSG